MIIFLVLLEFCVVKVKVVVDVWVVVIRCGDCWVDKDRVSVYIERRGEGIFEFGCLFDVFLEVIYEFEVLVDLVVVVLIFDLDVKMCSVFWEFFLCDWG